MDTKVINDYKANIKAMKAFAKDVSSTKEKALDFLYKAGIVTKKGKLTKRYR